MHEESSSMQIPRYNGTHDTMRREYTDYKSETLGSLTFGFGFVKNKVPDSDFFCIKTTNEDEDEVFAALTHQSLLAQMVCFRDVSAINQFVHIPIRP